MPLIELAAKERLEIVPKRRPGNVWAAAAGGSKTPHQALRADAGHSQPQPRNSVRIFSYNGDQGESELSPSAKHDGRSLRSLALSE